MSSSPTSGMIRAGREPDAGTIADARGRAAFVRTDVTKADEAQRLVDETVEQFGRAARDPDGRRQRRATR